ncbi:MAG: hypothetical protein M1136_05640 [Chloroflexi bacterium]|nr:hypothetical protein [Chloroflexota bacterium]
MMRLLATVLLMVVMAGIGGLFQGNNPMEIAYPGPYPGPYTVYLPVVFKLFDGSIEGPPPMPTATASPVPPLPTATPIPTATPTQALPTATPLPTLTPLPGGSLTCADLDGTSYLLADDGQYLGVISHDRYLEDSIMNKYGTYGSPYSATSIMNKYGTYGSPYSALSAYNPYTMTPPSIYIYTGTAVGYLTENPYLSPRCDTSDLVDFLRLLQ